MSVFEGVSALPAHFFEEISKIPRASGNEEGVAAYLERFAAERGLFCVRDKWNNVFIRKEGRGEKKNAAPILLQAHTDMVAAKEFGVEHDFDHDGIRLRRKGDFLFADGTTLGADDGFGVALMLAVLADDSLSSPSVECLFTTGEETGLGGAKNFDYTLVRARRVLNLDSSDEKEVVVGSCGGIYTEITLPVDFEKGEFPALTLTLEGLCGGHSGEDIHKGRANAIRTLGVVLEDVAREVPLRLCRVAGGDKDNAIPTAATAIVTSEDMDALRAISERAAEHIGHYLSLAKDADARLLVADTVADARANIRDSARIIRLLTAPDGVLRYRVENADLPDLSRNLAKVTTISHAVVTRYFSRAFTEKGLDFCRDDLTALALTLGGTAKDSGRHAGWESDPDSDVVRAWRAAMPIDTRVTWIHAGLECSIFAAKIPDCTALSVGCNIYDLHTPRERMELSSFERVYRALLKFLASL